MDLNYVDIVFQVIVLLFGLSLHEAAHAWMADKCGDPTAKMLGRVTLNPAKHIDPIGTIVMPIIGLLSKVGLFGWAKPCPVTPENFKHPVRDDILVSLAGPATNLFQAIVAGILLAIISRNVEGGAMLVLLGFGRDLNVGIDSNWVPVVWLLVTMLYLNLLLTIFNLLPIPPLDGSHVVRHFLPGPMQHAYDSLGFLGYILPFLVATPILRFIFPPIMQAVFTMVTGISIDD